MLPSGDKSKRFLSFISKKNFCARSSIIFWLGGNKLFLPLRFSFTSSSMRQQRAFFSYIIGNSSSVPK